MNTIYSSFHFVVSDNEEVTSRKDEHGAIHVKWGTQKASINFSGTSEDLQKLFLDAYKAIMNVPTSEIDRDEEFI
jgi:hypothetical protein